jgi:hypothetical protein
MGPPLLYNLTPENQQLLAELAALGSSSLTNSTPPGYFDPDYVPLVNLGSTIVGVTISFTVIALIAVCFRVYTRTTQKERPLGLDDFTIVPGMVSLTEILRKKELKLLPGFCYCP